MIPVSSVQVHDASYGGAFENCLRIAWRLLSGASLRHLWCLALAPGIRLKLRLAWRLHAPASCGICGSLPVDEGLKALWIFKKVAMADKRSPDASPISPKFYSARIESLKVAKETLDVNSEQANAKVEIEFFKVHWSESVSSYHMALGGPAMDLSIALPEWANEVGTPEWELEVADNNVRVFRILQENYPGSFFVDENDFGPDYTQRLAKWMLADDGTPLRGDLKLSSERPFAEGGQAELFRAHLLDVDSGERVDIFVTKVLMKGMLKRPSTTLPPTILIDDGTCIEGLFGDCG